MPSKTRRQQAYQHKTSHKMLFLTIALVAIIAVSIGAVWVVGNEPPPAVPPTKVLLQTTAGNITIDLRTDKPITSNNFINIVKSGKYDDTTFYRTMTGFMIQGGKINGKVPDIKDEIGSNNYNTNYTVAMAKTSSPNSASCEFFINAANNSAIPNFDSTYTVFGNVISGKDIVDKIANAPATANPNNPSEISNPVDPVRLVHATIVP